MAEFAQPERTSVDAKYPAVPGKLKRAAVRLIQSGDRSVPQLEKEPGVSQGSLRNWAIRRDVTRARPRPVERRTSGAQAAAQAGQGARGRAGARRAAAGPPQTPSSSAGMGSALSGLQIVHHVPNPPGSALNHPYEPVAAAMNPLQISTLSPSRRGLENRGIPGSSPRLPISEGPGRPAGLEAASNDPKY